MEPKRLDTVKTVRLPHELAAKLFAYCKRMNCSTSDAMRFALAALVNQPIGYRCEHLNITSLPGLLGEVSTWCGCKMSPIYEGSAVR